MSKKWPENGTKPLSPYFKALARQPHICPRCLKHKLRLVSLELTWDGAVWKCDGCGWFQVELAPADAQLGPREPEDVESEPREPGVAKKGPWKSDVVPNVIKADFGRRG